MLMMYSVFVQSLVTTVCIIMKLCIREFCIIMSVDEMCQLMNLPIGCLNIGHMAGELKKVAGLLTNDYLVDVLIENFQAACYHQIVIILQPFIRLLRRVCEAFAERNPYHSLALFTMMLAAVYDIWARPFGRGRLGAGRLGTGPSGRGTYWRGHLGATV
jgi:hypothetical protein